MYIFIFILNNIIKHEEKIVLKTNVTLSHSILY